MTTRLKYYINLNNTLLLPIFVQSNGEISTECKQEINEIVKTFITNSLEKSPEIGKEDKFPISNATAHLKICDEDNVRLFNMVDLVQTNFSIHCNVNFIVPTPLKTQPFNKSFVSFLDVVDSHSKKSRSIYFK
ncbi:Uncharacterized protein QTN25_008203 [Entamoeba marina]